MAVARILHFSLSISRFSPDFENFPIVKLDNINCFNTFLAGICDVSIFSLGSHAAPNAPFRRLPHRHQDCDGQRAASPAGAGGYRGLLRVAGRYPQVNRQRLFIFTFYSKTIIISMAATRLANNDG